MLIDFIKGIAENKNVTLTLDENALMKLAYKAAFSEKLDRFTVYRQYVNRDLIKVMQISVALGKEVVINDRLVSTWADIKDYQVEIAAYIVRREQDAWREEAIKLISADRDLKERFIISTDALESYIDNYIKDSGYDVSMSSCVPADKKSVGHYENRQGKQEVFSRTYIKTWDAYQTTLLDKLNMYTNVKWYTEHGFKPEFKEEEEDIVTPFSACTWTERNSLE